jgi:hypothetical protein
MVANLCRGWNRTNPLCNTSQWLAAPRVRSTFAARQCTDYFLGHCLSSSTGAFVVTIIPVPAQFWQGISLPEGCFSDPLPSQIEQVCFVVIKFLQAAIKSFTKEKGRIKLTFFN